MATAAMTTAGLKNQTVFGNQAKSHVIPPYYADFMRENLYANLYFRQLGTLAPIPHGSGDKIKIPRWDTPITSYDSTNSRFYGYTTLDNAVTAVNENISEGVTITPKGLSAEGITGKVVQFAGARGYSDKLILITRANFMEGALESLIRELSFRLDRYTRKNITASAVQRNAGAGAAAHSTEALFGKEMAKIPAYMDVANTPRWEDDSFVGVINPLTQYDIFKDTSANGFVSVRRYNDAVDIYRGEIGEAYGVRWLLSNAIPRLLGPATTKWGVSAGASGSAAFVFAPDAFYSLELENGGVEVIHHPPGSGGSTGDPANQIGSIAVKVWYGVCDITPIGATVNTDHRLMIFGHGQGLASKL